MYLELIHARRCWKRVPSSVLYFLRLLQVCKDWYPLCFVLFFHKYTLLCIYLYSSVRVCKKLLYHGSNYFKKVWLHWLSDFTLAFIHFLSVLGNPHLSCYLAFIFHFLQLLERPKPTLILGWSLIINQHPVIFIADSFLCVGLGLGKTDSPQVKSRKSMSSERTFSATEDEAILYQKLGNGCQVISFLYKLYIAMAWQIFFFPINYTH